MQFSTMAGTAVGMAVGAAAVCLATQDQRMMRKTVHKLAKGAEKTLADLEKAVAGDDSKRELLGYASDVMELMTKLRADWGVVHPEEE